MLTGGIKISNTDFNNGCDILVCTLGKLSELISKNAICFQHLKFIVFDDAEGVHHLNLDPNSVHSTSQENINFVETIEKNILKAGLIGINH